MLGLLLQAFAVTALVWGFVAVMTVIIFKQNVSITLPPWIPSAEQSLQRRVKTYISRFQEWLKQPGQHVRVGLWIGTFLIALITWVSPKDSFFGQFRTEAVSVALAVIVIDELNRYRDRLQRKQVIIEQMGSPVNDTALEAVRFARKHGWNTDDSLEGANLENAVLKGAHLRMAHVDPDAVLPTPPEQRVADRPLPLIGEALLLNDDAYAVMRAHQPPMRHGALVLLWIVLIAALARIVGLAFGLLTTPRLDLIQQSLYDIIAQMSWFTDRAAALPEFVGQFQQIYGGAWELVRLVGGYPSAAGTLAAVGAIVLGTLANWLAYGLIAHWTARWFGGQARLGQFYGALALAYAPLLLTVILLVPGSQIAFALVFLALLVSKFLAVKVTYGLDPGQSLAVTAAPYLLGTLLAAALVIFGAAYGIGRIPYIDQIISLLRIFPGL